MNNVTAYLLICIATSMLNFSCKSEKVNSSNPDEDESDPVIITDVEGNEYHTIRIGSQLWTVEDLRTTKYNDGTAIPLVTGDTAWSNCTFGAYCSYFNSENADTIRKYGLFYNWYAVNTGKLVPKGWHVPSQNDWNKLRDYLIANGYNWDSTLNDNKIAKSIASQNDWKYSATAGTIGNDRSLNNKSGFSALPGGSRYSNGIFGNRGLMSHWWSSTPTYADLVFSEFLTYENQAIILHNVQKTKGFVVRIVKD